MGALQLLRQMHAEGTLSSAQLDVLSVIHKKERFSLHYELRGLIYAGVLLIILGAGLTIKTYLAAIGHLAIITALSLGATTAIGYCFYRGEPFGRDEVPSPNIGFDYVLFLGCSLYSLNVAYIETQFHLLGDGWDSYLIVSAILFFYLAYRFDNRLVLSFALGTLAAWFGFKLNWAGFSFWDYHRLYAIVFGLLSLTAGLCLWRANIKKHFLDTYLNFALHFLFIALVSGVFAHGFLSLYCAGLVVLTAAVIFYALQRRKFLYFLYAVLYGYVALSYLVIDTLVNMQGPSFPTGWILTYFIISSLAVVWLIMKTPRRFKEAPMNLCLYTPEREENLFIRKRAKTWQRSGLISEDQFKILEERTSSQLAETPLFFRILCFVFTWICLSATIELVVWMLGFDAKELIGFLSLSLSIPVYVLAEYLVRRPSFLPSRHRGSPGPAEPVSFLRRHNAAPSLHAQTLG